MTDETIKPCPNIQSLYAAYLQTTAHNAEAAATLTLANIISCCRLSVELSPPEIQLAGIAAEVKAAGESVVRFPEADDADDADPDDTVLTADAKAPA